EQGTTITEVNLTLVDRVVVTCALLCVLMWLWLIIAFAVELFTSSQVLTITQASVILVSTSPAVFYFQHRTTA
ncbi:hypothetical protein LCGC14_2507130, partial [marine sediment metagenome]